MSSSSQDKTRSKAGGRVGSGGIAGASRMRLVIVGFGQMGEALARGMLATHPDAQVSTVDVLEERIRVAKALGIKVAEDLQDAAKSSDILVLCVKPKQVVGVLDKAASVLTEHHLLISIAAGVPLCYIEKRVQKARVIRVMPNINATVREAFTVIAPGKRASPSDCEEAVKIFSSIGRAEVADETVLDAVTGLGGSGPGFMFAVIDALADGGARVGLRRDLAIRMAAQVALGSGKLVLESGKHPSELKDAVATPAGTTIEGLYQMEKAGLRATLIDAVTEATKKSREISEEFRKHSVSP